MRYSLRALLLTLVLLLFSAISAYGQNYSISEINIENINIPDEYFVCDRENCDREFKKILASRGFTFDELKNKVMIPDDIYLYAIKEDGTVLYVKYETFTKHTLSIYNTRDKEEYSELTKLTYDYKLVSDSIDKENAIKKYRYNITSNGIKDNDISRINWIDNGQKEGIPYILCSYKKDDVYIADYHTVFNGCKLSVTVIEYEPIILQKLMKISDMVSSVKYTHMPDYTDAKIILKEKQEKEKALKNELYSAARNLQFIFGFFISLMLLSAIYVDYRKIISKRRNDSY